MQKTLIDHAVTGLLPRLTSDYLQQAPHLRNFYQYAPEATAFADVIRDKANDDTPRQLLVDVLTGQYQGLTRDPAVDRNIAALAAANTFTVTTGHQLCLFTGPLYFLYKIMTAINLSAQLNAAHPDQHVVPVYWMASEDHDFAEINHAFLFNRELSWETGYGGMVGEIATESLRPVLDELGSILGEGEVANELRQLLEEAYAGQANLSDATRHLVNRLFGAYGVVVIDANDPRLKAHFVPVMEDDLFAHSAFQQASETKRHLEEQYKLPVNPREINLFYCRDGQRERIVREGNTWSVLNAEHAFTEATLRQELADHPERFSPNVVLRPLYQEQLLPNLAYIGGPSEVAYWLELKGVFEHYKTNFPMVLLRNMVLLVNATMQKRMAKLDLSAETLFEPADALIARLVKAGTEASLELTDEKAALDALYAGLVEKAVAVDPTLKRAVEGEHQKQLKALGALEAKLVRAEKKKQETTVNQVRGLHDKVFPAGSFQERKENFIPHYLRHGAALIPDVLAQLDPMDVRLHVLTEAVENPA